MGRIKLYRYHTEEGFLECDEIKNEHGYGLGGGTRYFQRIWYDLEKEYLPPLGFRYDGSRESRLDLFMPVKKIQEVWDLAKGEQLEEYENMLLKSTFTYYFIRYESIDKFCNAIRDYQKKYKVGDEFENILKALEHEKECNRSKFFTLQDSVSDLAGLVEFVEDMDEADIDKMLTSEKYSDFKIDIENYWLFLDLEKLDGKQNIFI